MTDPRNIRRYWILLVGCVLITSPSSADRIISGSDILQRVRIVDLDGARVAYRTSTGAMQFLLVTEIDRIYVDSLATATAFNEAEKLVEQGNPTRALTHYARALRLADGFWRELTRARIVQAADKAKRIDTLATQFVALLSDETASPALAAELLPRRVLLADQNRVSRALATVNAVIPDARSQSARVLLEMLRFLIADGSGHPSAGGWARELVLQPIPPVIASQQAYRVKARALARWAKATAPDEAMAEINTDIRLAPYDVLPELLMVKAHVLGDAAGDDEALARSAWAAMRVVIHFPDHRLTPEALLFTAGLHDRLGNQAAALRLLGECNRHAKTDAEVGGRVSAMIDRIKAAD